MKRSNKVLFAIIVIALIFSFGCNKTISQVTDIDGNVYKTVSIGTQFWMAENLNVEHYRNGDLIPQVQDREEWANLTTGAWCYYDNDPENGKTYGKLYNWYAVNDPRGLAPEGYHIPSDAEWTQLTDYLGDGDEAGGKLKAITKWKNPNTGATNSSGFTAFPGGELNVDIGFYGVSEVCLLWSSLEEDNGNAWYRFLSYNDSDEDSEYGSVYAEMWSASRIRKQYGLSCRCVKD